MACLARRDVATGLIALVLLVLLPLYFYGSRVQSAAARFLFSASGGEVAHFPHAGFVSERPKIAITPGEPPSWKPFRKHRVIHRRPLAEETAHFTREQINAHKAAVARPLPQGPPASSYTLREQSSALAAVSRSAVSKSSSSFVSWDLQLSFRPAEVFFPETIKDLVRIVRQCAKRRQKVRVIGSFYSFQPLPESSDVLISSERLNRVVEINGRGRWVHVEAGIKFIDLSQHERLFQKMAGLEIFPADSLITVGGALSTGSHGVGNRQLGSISSLVVEITVVTAAGKLVTLTAKRNPELFYAAQVSLGVLGIIASVKLSVVHIQKLRFERVQSVIAPDRLLLELPALETKHQKQLFFWHLDLVEETSSYVVAQHSGRPIKPCSNTLTRRTHESAKCIDRSYRVLASQNTASSINKYVEIEYFIPSASLNKVVSRFADFNEETKSSRTDGVSSSLHVSYQSHELAWLAPAFGLSQAPVAAVALIVRPLRAVRDPNDANQQAMVWTEFTRIARKFEDLCRDEGGRPHWAKHHFVPSDEFQSMYPRFADFARLRRRLDPDNMFLNDFLAPMFLSADAAEARGKSLSDSLRAPRLGEGGSARTAAINASATDSSGRRPNIAAYDLILEAALEEDPKPSEKENFSPTVEAR